jgi:transposase InsO family protein
MGLCWSSDFSISCTAPANLEQPSFMPNQLHLWVRRLDEPGERPLIQTVEPVNRYPGFVRNLVRQFKCLFPAMGYKRMAQVLARVGLVLGSTTIRRIAREHGTPPDDESQSKRRRRRVVARYPGHGFWVPWFPFSLPQRCPFCWWVALAVDQVSRAIVGFAVFSQLPSSDQVQRFLQRAIRERGSTPKYVVTDKGKQFWCHSFKRWCKRRGIRPRYGRVGEPASIAIVERCIRSLKQECTQCLLVPLSLAAFRRDLRSYACWYNTVRPHSALAGKTLEDICSGNSAKRQRLEPRPNWPHRHPRIRADGDKFSLAVSYIDGRKHLPVVDLRRAA